MILDSNYFADMFGTQVMREAFSDAARIESWLATEAAIARVQGRMGIIPAEASEHIQAAARLEHVDVAAMREDYLRVGFPILPLVRQLAAACDEESKRWVHWGATTQDIIDTGLVLQMRAGLDLLEADLRGIMEALAALVKEHRTTVMAGRTFRQQAAPITFGFKAAVWLDELIRHRQRLDELRPRALMCSYGGAVGNLSTLGSQGAAVLSELSRDLELEEPAISWHTARDGWSDVIYWLSLVAATLAKIATEVSTLMGTEMGEVREPFQKGRGASSTMPQKRNPIACPIIIANATKLRDTIATQLSAMNQDHERSVAGQPTEWLIIPEAFVLASGVLSHSREMLTGLEIDQNRMRENLDIDDGLLMSESVMMGLATSIGRGRAHSLVSAAAGRAIEQGTSLRTELLADSAIMDRVSMDQLDALLDPANYLGSTATMIDKVLTHYENSRDK